MWWSSSKPEKIFSKPLLCHNRIEADPKECSLIVNSISLFNNSKLCDFLEKRNHSQIKSESTNGGMAFAWTAPDKPPGIIQSHRRAVESKHSVKKWQFQKDKRPALHSGQMAKAEVLWNWGQCLKVLLPGKNWESRLKEKVSDKIS